MSVAISSIILFIFITHPFSLFFMSNWFFDTCSYEHPHVTDINFTTTFTTLLIAQISTFVIYISYLIYVSVYEIMDRYLELIYNLMFTVGVHTCLVVLTQKFVTCDTIYLFATAYCINVLYGYVLIVKEPHYN